MIFKPYLIPYWKLSRLNDYFQLHLYAYNNVGFCFRIKGIGIDIGAIIKDTKAEPEVKE